MNIRLFLFSFCFLIGNLQAMEQMHDFARHPERTNVFAIQHGHLGGTYVENQYIHNNLNEEFTKGQPFMDEMMQGFKNGSKQTAFDIGNCAGTFIKYGLQITSTIAVTSIFEVLKERIMYFWNKQDLAKQKDQQQLDRLLTYYGILQNLIKEHPRTTEAEREEFRKLLEQKVILTKKLGARLAAHMTEQENDLTTPVTA